MRVYLCEYDKTNLPTLPPGTDPEDYINKITVGMVATIDAGNGKHPDHPSSQEDNGFLVLTLEPLNNGKLCPPDCP